MYISLIGSNCEYFHNGKSCGSSDSQGILLINSASLISFVRSVEQYIPAYIWRDPKFGHTPSRKVKNKPS